MSKEELVREQNLITHRLEGRT
jgi:hypothetical protein